MMKDNFSLQSDNYARYRPVYPDELFAFLETIRTGTENAWDCGTGNGQAAQKLVALFTHVYATDISQAQLNNAVKLPAIHYSLQPAEATSFPPGFFDLVMVAQAVHWFDFEKFYAEVVRTAKPHALLVITGYGKLKVTPPLDAIIDRLYYNIVGPYWDKERRYIDDNYQTIPFPFEELPTPSFRLTYEWTLEQLVGYFETWSAVKHYRKQHRRSPVDLILEDLRGLWGEAEKRTVQFPLLLRIGKI
jgi:SAM-dependent methyltransferase